MRNGNLYIDTNIISTLLAISSSEQEKGLMHQPWPPPVMTFVYSSPKFSKFWMKNTPSPLDIIFCCDNKIVEICKGEPHSTNLVGTQLSDLVVELPFGTANKLGLGIGSRVGLVNPSLEELKKIMGNF